MRSKTPLLLVALLGACAPLDGPSNGASNDAGGGGLGAGGSSGSDGQGGSSGGPTAGGAAGLGGAGSGGAASGGAGSSGAPQAGTGGTLGGAGAGGTGAGTSPGGMSGAGSGGTGGLPSTGGGAGAGGASGGAGTGAGGSEDLRAAAAILDGFSILKPCVSSFRPSGNANNAGDCCCEELASNENQHITRQFGGEAGANYNVTLRIAGVAERYWYSGGTLDATSRLFYRGGLPTIHSTSAPNDNLRPGQGACKVHPPETDAQFALPFTVPTEIRPSDGCYNGFNVFAMTVSAPGQAAKQSYYLNYTTDFDNIDRQPHSVYKTDYTVTVSIPGQATLDFYTIDGDHHQVTNNGTMTVPSLRTTQPYNGNFLEFTVVNVTR